MKCRMLAELNVIIFKEMGPARKMFIFLSYPPEVNLSLQLTSRITPDISE